MNRFGETQHSTLHLDDFDISDASANIPPVPKHGDDAGLGQQQQHQQRVSSASTPYNYNPVSDYPHGRNGGGNMTPPFTRRYQQQENREPVRPRAHFGTKLDNPDFVISDSDNNKPLRANNNNFGLGGGFSDILSPQIPASEVKRHFNDFSSAFNIPDDNNYLYDQSIEFGRSTKGKHQPERTFSSVASSRGGSPMHKVTDKPGSGYYQGRTALSPDFMSKRRVPNRNTGSMSPNEKVTSSSSSPDLQQKKTAFKIPTGYGDDASFFEKLGIKKPVDLPQVGKKGLTSESEGAKSNEPITLPDISGLSSIFSSDDNKKNGNRKASNQQHKTLVSVPLDPDEKALFSAFSSFQSSISKLEEEKQKLQDQLARSKRDYGSLDTEYKRLKHELSRISQTLDQQARHFDEQLKDYEQKARKYKAMASSLRDYSKSLESSLNSGNPHGQELMHLKALYEESQGKLYDVSEQRNAANHELDSARGELRMLHDELSRLKSELAYARGQPEPPQRSEHEYTARPYTNPYQRPQQPSHAERPQAQQHPYSTFSPNTYNTNQQPQFTPQNYNAPAPGQEFHQQQQFQQHQQPFSAANVQPRPQETTSWTPQHNTAPPDISLATHPDFRELASRLISMLAGKDVTIQPNGKADAPDVNEQPTEVQSSPVANSEPESDVTKIRRLLEELLTLQKGPEPKEEAKPKKDSLKKNRKSVVIEDAVDDDDQDDYVAVSSDDDESENEVEVKRTKSQRKKPTKAKPAEPAKETPRARLIDRVNMLSNAQCQSCSQKEEQINTHNHINVEPSSKSHDSPEAETTLPPPVEPEDAAKFVLNKMGLDYTALKLAYNALTSDYSGSNPSVDFSHRHEVAAQLKNIINEMKSKGDEMYAMRNVMTGTNLGTAADFELANGGGGSGNGPVLGSDEIMGQYSWMQD